MFIFSVVLVSGCGTKKSENIKRELTWWDRPDIQRLMNRAPRYTRQNVGSGYGSLGLGRVATEVAGAGSTSYLSNNYSTGVRASTGYQHGWRVYKKPQPGYSYSNTELNPYGPGGSKSYAPGGGLSYGDGGALSYGPGGGLSYGEGGALSYGPGGGKDISNPWEPINQ